jgi:hypothetical protein
MVQKKAKLGLLSYLWTKKISFWLTFGTIRQISDVFSASGQGKPALASRTWFRSRPKDALCSKFGPGKSFVSSLDYESRLLLRVWFRRRPKDGFCSFFRPEKSVLGLPLDLKSKFLTFFCFGTRKLGFYLKNMV